MPSHGSMLPQPGRLFKLLTFLRSFSFAAKRAADNSVINSTRVALSSSPRSRSSSRYKLKRGSGYSHILCCYSDVTKTSVKCMNTFSSDNTDKPNGRSSSSSHSTKESRSHSDLSMDYPRSQIKVKDLDLILDQVNGEEKFKVESCDKMSSDAAFKIKTGYERAVNELHRLISNAENVARSIKSQAERQEKQHAVVPNMRRFFHRSGISDEEIDGLSIIHVSGTKGKGSTCAFVERILRAKGYKTGLFSSPHLVEVRERFRVNGRPISRDLYVEHFWKVYSKLRETETNETDMPAYFAFNCVLCLHIFLAEAVDVIIMEVGIGGEYDSTNFIRKPAVCGVTSLGLDHTALLGNTLDKIAWNKGGIFKNGRPALSVSQSSVCLDVLLGRAKERKSPFHIVPELPAQLLEKEKFRLGIAGKKQVVNASLAVQLARQWEKSQHTELLPCNVESTTASEDIPVMPVTELTAAEIEGLSSCVWPGRAQTIRRPGITYYLDGAHTVESMEVCCDWFTEASKEEEESISGKVARILLFNVTGDRNTKALLTTLKHRCPLDAAAFSTNSVSTIAAYNVAVRDHQATKISLNDMARKAASNRALWDSLNFEVGEVDNNNSHECSRHGGGGGRIQNGTGGEEKTTSTTGSLGSSAPLTSDGDYAPPAKKGHYSADSAGHTNLLKPPIGTTAAAANNSTKASLARNISTTVTTDDSSVTTTQSVSSSGMQTSNGGDRSESKVILDNDETVRGSRPESSIIINNNNNIADLGKAKNLSYSFPCILQAMSWATQGRDPEVRVKDAEACLPAVPEGLQYADHIQVLVTGSLHLVGAALAVLDPNLND